MKEVKFRFLLTAGIVLFLAPPAFPQGVEFVAVQSRPASREVDLPGEIAAYMSVALHAKVAGHVERIPVDRGSKVRRGDLLAELSAPEIESQIAAAQARFQAAEAESAQAAAQLAAAQGTVERLQAAARTPGAVAGHEVMLAEKQTAATRALLDARRQACLALEQAVRSLKEQQSYLRITAPFDGVVTERLVHPGALVGPGADPVLLVLQQVSRLRLVVAVPEEHVGGISPGSSVRFTVPAYPGSTFSGTVARLSHVLDPRTRTMPVEVEVGNADGALAPGMYPTVRWTARRTQPALLVPRTSVVTTSERTFVVRNRQGKANWVEVRKLASYGDLVEVLGDLQAGDMVVRRATDEMREGQALGTPTF